MLLPPLTGPVALRDDEQSLAVADPKRKSRKKKSLRAHPSARLYLPLGVAPFLHSMAEWTKTVRHFARLFKRGWKKKVYRAVCKADGFKSCPPIIGPLKVRMAVHCGRFLKQSCQHHSVRCAAVAAALQRLRGKARGVDKMRKQLSELEHCLRSLHVFVAMLVEECLHMPRGVMSGCLAVQAALMGPVDIV